MTTPIEKQRVRVRDLSIACVDRGAGRPLVFLHGNPTSSFLWPIEAASWS